MKSSIASPTNPTGAAIWGRIFQPDRPTFTPELARTILKLDFDPEDHHRVAILAMKANEGTLAPTERAEYEEYIRVDETLSLLQSKARLSLKRSELEP